MTGPSPADVERAVTRLREAIKHNEWYRAECKLCNIREALGKNEALALLLDAREELACHYPHLPENRCRACVVRDRLDAALVRWAEELG